MLEFIAYYWPRLLFGAWVSFTLTMMMRDRYQPMRRVLNFFVLFFTSCAVVSIATEVLAGYTYEELIRPLTTSLPSSVSNGLQFSFFIVCYTLSIIFPIYVLAKMMKEHWTVAAGVYMIYVVFDNAALIISVTQWMYLLIIALLLFGAFLASKDDMNYVMNHAKTVEWRPVLHCVIGVYVLLECLYGAYYIFPDVIQGEFNMGALWIDIIAIAAMLFFASYCKMNLRASKEQMAKFAYLEELKDSQRDIIQKFAELSEAKSGETGQHVRRVAEYSALLAKEYGFDEDDVECIRIASMMHDLGKLLIPREIIEKPGALTHEEMMIMRQHTVYGKDILANSNGEVIKMASVIANEHHERWDGNGYPNGISGDDISVYAQIVSVADVYDALTSRRSYKEPWDIDRAKNEIIAQSGRQFSPKVVDVFEKSFDKIRKIQLQYAD